MGALAVVLFATSISGNSAAVTAVRRADDGAAVRLAVLPFAADDAGDEARALGITDELITALGEAYAVKLEVIALRTAMRYRASDAAPPAIAREFGVDYLVDGRLRSQTGRLRIAVRLVRAADSAQLWARTFEQPAQGSWTIEAAIAQDVTAALGRVLLPHRAPPDAALDADSQQDYLRARYALRRGQPRRAAQTLAALTARVPRSAKAWAALALAELRTGPDRFAAAARAASTALELDPAHAEAHHVRAIVALYAEWDPERARRHLEAALATNPGIAEAHHDLAACYSAAGRHDDAIAAMQRALALDPRAPEVVSDVGWYYYFARHYADAALWCGRTLALEPTFYWAHRCIVMSRMRQGDRTAAVAAALDHLRARGAPPAILAAVQASDLAAYWRWELDARTDATNATDAADRAVAHLALGDRAAALDDLERAVATHRGWVLPFLSVDPTFDELRDQPRFQAVLHTIAAGAAL